MLAANLNTLVYAGAGIVIVLLVILIAQVFILRAKLNRLNKKYHYFMNGHDGVSVERQLSAEVKQLRDMVSASEGMLHQQELLANMQLESFQRMGLINYDAFDATGDKLSFSLTLLNGRNDGFVFSCLTGSGTSRIYAKRVINGRCKSSLSSEEADSINMALNTQMPNVVLAAQEAAAAREAERQEREHREKKREPKRRRTVRKPKHEEPAQPVRQAEEKVQPAPVQETAPAEPAGQAVKTEIRSTGNEPFVSTQSAQPVKPLGNATEADLSLFSSSGSKRPARRGQYRVNHEERRK